ncbi:hypothetical protein WT85_04970 [Burkholderia stagnalis]|nr:hypothetical protein WT85_04970 [Burkholderia stagnalis]
MIQHVLLVMAMQERFPELVHGKDYFVAHPLDRETGEQSGDAYIDTWHGPGDQPDIAPLLKRAEELRPDHAMADVRWKRNTLLSSSDWTQAPDVPQAVRDKWIPYRQALRDLTEQPNFPFDVNWPEVPR